EQVMHYNGFPAAEINGAAAPGFSSGQAQNAVADVLRQKLPSGMSFEWTELAYQEIVSGNTMVLVFPLCVLLVYVVLAAQYESWSLPLSVILNVPMDPLRDRRRVGDRRRQQRLHANQFSRLVRAGVQE